VVFADYDMDIHYSNGQFGHVKEFRGCAYRTADEFLSGNVREKLKLYAAVRDSLEQESPY
jgi:hypothetical protein